MKNIILIGNPRSATTAFERYMIKRGDYDVYHEPVSTHIWNVVHNRDDVYPREYTGDQILQIIHNQKRYKPYFVKEIAYFLVENNFLYTLMLSENVQVIFLIRHPEQAVLSHYKLARFIDVNIWFGKTSEQMQYSRMETLFFRTKSLTNEIPIIFDADELVIDPSAVLSNICARIGIPFRESDLIWETGEKELWSRNANTWQLEVTNSTGFFKPKMKHCIEEVAAEDRYDIDNLILTNEIIYEKLMCFSGSYFTKTYDEIDVDPENNLKLKHKLY